MRFKVPQNIDIQDRIIGPLTMVQFVVAVIGFGTSYVIYMAIPAPISFFLIAPVAIFTLCYDFVKVNERPFWDFFIAVVSFLSAPKQRVWHQGTDSDLQIEVYKAQVKQENTIQSKNISHDQIKNFAQKYDSGSTLIKK